jgi:PadR family transcriptional regulator PadR
VAKTDHLGEFEQLALLAVMRLGDDAWGARIQEELDATAEREASISAIYITLTRLEKKGMVRSWMGPPSDERGGKARRYFAVEPEGVVALDEARRRLLSMWDGLEADLEAAVGSARPNGP